MEVTEPDLDTRPTFEEVTPETIGAGDVAIDERQGEPPNDRVALLAIDLWLVHHPDQGGRSLEHLFVVEVEVCRSVDQYQKTWAGKILEDRQLVLLDRRDRILAGPENQGRSGEPGKALWSQRGFHDRMQSLADRELILSPNRWPKYPFLCLAHRSEKDEVMLPRQGLIYEKYPNCVFTVNLYDIPMFWCEELSNGKPPITEEEFMAWKIEYGSPEAILREWQID